jgi:Holliday junction resolvase-like predicted endonuclease
MNKKNLGEIDFVLQRGKAVVPVEVKSGGGYKTHAALNNVMRVSEWNINNAYVFCMGNVDTLDNITYLPWYMVMFFKQERLPAHLIVDVNPGSLD